MKKDRHYKITPHQDINHIIEMLSEGLKSILRNQLLGVYLTGSLTYGDFNRGNSDIDFLVVMHSSLSDDQRHHVKDLHDKVAKKYPLWAERIECSYITDDMLHSVNPPIQPRPYVNGGKMWSPDPPYGNEWLLNLYVLYECGIHLVGPDPKILIGHPISTNAVRDASKKDLHQEWEPLLKDPSPLMDSHFQAYVILTLCRILYRAKHDNIATKKISSAWVKKTYGMPWSDLIKKAESWQHGHKLDAVNETLDFIRFTLQELETMVFAFKPLQDTDLNLLCNWLNEPHVKEWWDDKLTNEEIKSKYKKRIGDSIVVPFIVLLNDKPIGFIQYYQADKVGDGWWPDAIEGTIGIDQFIGEKDLINRGIGTKMIRAFIEYLYLKSNVNKIITDVDPKNVRAIRCYEKVGFKFVKEIMTPDGLAYLMVMDNH